MEHQQILIIINLIVTGIVGIILVAQIVKQNQIIQNLKKYSEIIDIDKIKKYADLRTESDKINLDIAVKKASDKIVKRVIKTHVEPELEMYHKEVKEMVDELMELAFDVIISERKDLRRKVIDNFLPFTKTYILPQLEEYEKTELHDTPTP
jgi:hypothetical protein